MNLVVENLRPGSITILPSTKIIIEQQIIDLRERIENIKYSDAEITPHDGGSAINAAEIEPLNKRLEELQRVIRFSVETKQIRNPQRVDLGTKVSVEIDSHSIERYLICSPTDYIYQKTLEEEATFWVPINSPLGQLLANKEVEDQFDYPNTNEKGLIINIESIEQPS